MIFSNVISILALLISSLSLYVSWKRYRRDRSHLALRLTFDANHTPRNLSLLVVNDGQRPTTIIKVTAKTSHGDIIPVAVTPKQLKEGEYFIYNLPSGTVGDIVTRFDVIDVFDTIYPLTVNRNVRRLQNDYIEHHYLRYSRYYGYYSPRRSFSRVAKEVFASIKQALKRLLPSLSDDDDE